MATKLALVVVLAACSSKEKAAAPAPPPPVPDAAVVIDAPPVTIDAAEAADNADPDAPDIEGVAFELEVIPAKMSKAKSAKALMRITVTNNSKRVISPVRMGYSFTVD